MPPGAQHQSAALSTPKMSLQEIKMKEDHVSCLFNNVRITKAFEGHIHTVTNSGGSRSGVWGGSQIGVRQNVFTCLNTKVVCDNRCVSHKRGYLL